jgi:hypothetical protein
VPIYVTWISLGKKIQRLEIDGISGSPLNVQEVPEREMGFIEITAETIDKLKTPQGWIDYSKKAGNWLADIAKQTGGTIAGNVKKSGIIDWLFKTKSGQYTLLTLTALILVYLVLKKYHLIR